MIPPRGSLLAVLLLSSLPSSGQSPVDRPAQNGSTQTAAAELREIPPPGIEVPEEVRKDLKNRLEGLEKLIVDLKGVAGKKPRIESFLPDVEIFHKAVAWALKYNEFYKDSEFEGAKSLIEEGVSRAKALREEKTPWTTQTGLVVRGYRSRVDDSVQPYGMVVPSNYHPEEAMPRRLDIWCHGRQEKMPEHVFLDGRRKQVGEYAPPGAFVLHPYGRFCNAQKFAGETDLFEALEHAQRSYRIDPDRVVMRGFSMGGASAWQFAVHHPGRWVAANPGAGFVETPEFLQLVQKGENPPWWVQRLWNWYDCPGYVRNLANCPTVAYSGEDDKQRQAATVMEAAAKEEGLTLTHILGSKTAHKIHPDSKIEIEKRLERIVSKGRQRFPKQVHLATYTLRYPTNHWVTIQGMEHHWNRAIVDAHLLAEERRIRVSTQNVTAVSLHCGPGDYPMDLLSGMTVEIDGEEVAGTRPASDGSWLMHLVRAGGRWNLSAAPYDGLVKRPGLQGPIDDAFMERFLVVRPTGKSNHPTVSKWVETELAHFEQHWRKQFRGDLRIKDDVAVTEDDIQDSNLILWGDPQSNALIGKIATQLPIRWDQKCLGVGDSEFSPEKNLPVLIYPNPLFPGKYVVINSGFTFREADYLNNARQGPKLPDWAIVSAEKNPDPVHGCDVLAAGFFGEYWQLVHSH